jgi:hypothetical protein
LGSTCTTALRCIWTSTPGATCGEVALAQRGHAAQQAAGGQHFIALGQGLDHGAVLLLRFICGRIMMKYSTTNISTSGSMLISEEDTSAAAPPAKSGQRRWK